MPSSQKGKTSLPDLPGGLKLLISKKVRQHVLTQLVEENSKLEHTKDIFFNELKLSNYLDDKRNHSLSKIIFSVKDSGH